MRAALTFGVVGAVTLGGFGIAWWILRWEFRHQLRQRRRGGFLIGGDR